MSSVGETLREAREAQKLSVTQVAEMTKIRSDHIRAIDAGNYDVFSAPVYIRGFVRTYATALKLDPAGIITQLNRELAESGGGALPPLKPHASGFLDSLMFYCSTSGQRVILPVLGLVLLAGATVGGYALWHRSHASNPLEGLSAGLYQPASPAAGETLPLPRH